MNDFTLDEYGEVINSDETYQAIARKLCITGSMLIGWTDEDGTHVDILFTLTPKKRGNIQGGLHLGTNLFVSIMRLGAFGFDIHEVDTPSGYYAAKLNLGGPNATTDKLADLINGVKDELRIAVEKAE